MSFASVSALEGVEAFPELAWDPALAQYLISSDGSDLQSIS